MENVCIICFDNFTIENPVCINPLECTCKFDIHEVCWLKWANVNEVILECPICHKYIQDTVKELQPEESIYFSYSLYYIIILIKFIYMCIKILDYFISFFLIFFF
jgi:hypothetical protein